MTDVGFSDHNMLLCSIHIDKPRPQVRTFKYRSLKIADPAVFAARLRLTDVFSSPADDVDEFAKQQDSFITAALDVLAPLKTRTVRAGKKSGRWLSTVAVAAKRKRRRLERRWKRGGAEHDRVAYRIACREANYQINRSRETFYHERLLSAPAGDQRTQWRVVRELLHTDDQRDNIVPVHARQLCIKFSRHFV